MTTTTPHDHDGLAAQNRALTVLLALPVSDAMGAACSFLLHCAIHEREKLRRVLNERVIREGFTGISLLELFKRVCK